MKKIQILSPLVIALGLIGYLPAWAAGAANAPVIVSNEGANGSVELSNISGTENQGPLAAETKADAAPTSEAVPAEVANAEAPKDPREMHRDKVMQMPEDMPVGTSAASRRYKKVDLATYRATMLGASAPASPTQQSGRTPAQ
jgi:hypothetical protein